MSGRSLDQQRAAHALACIDEVKHAGSSGNYANYVKALPAAILSIGLGQALASELAGGDTHPKVAEHLARWLLKAPGSLYRDPALTDEELKPHKCARALLDRIVDGDQRAYVWAQAEAIAYVGWLKKLAVAFLSKDDSSKQEPPRDVA
jgi:CRISPR-associated protein Cmr5